MADESFQIGGGGFRGASPTPLGQGLNRSLGVQGAGLPSFDPSAVLPVYLIGDTSKSLSRALAVRRGWMGRRQVVPAAQVFALGMRGYAGAGIVIERVRITPVAPAVFVLPFNIASAYLLPVAFIPGVAIGGTDMNQFIGGAVDGAHFDTRLPSGLVQLQSVASAFDPFDVPIFVPPSSRIIFETGDLGVDVDWEIIWREVPE